MFLLDRATCPKDCADALGPLWVDPAVRWSASKPAVAGRNGPSALAAGTTLHDSASDQSEQSLHQFAVFLGQRFEDREMVSPVDRQQMPRQSAFAPRRGVVNRLAA